MKVFFDLMWFFRAEKKAYILGIMMLLAVAFLELVPPRIIGVVTDEIVTGSLTSQELFKWGIVLVVAGVASYVLRYFWRIMIFGSSVKLAKLLRDRLYEHFTKMSPNFYQKSRTGDLMAHATNDLQAIQQTAGIGVLTMVDSLATGGFVIIAMAATLSWKLTLISLIPMPFMAILTGWYGKMLHSRFHKAQEAFSCLNDKSQESIAGVKVLKTFGQEKEDIEDFQKRSEDAVRKNISVAKVDSLFDPTISIIVGVSFFLSVVFGSRLVINGEMTIGELVSFTTYLGLLIWPMLAFGHLFNIVERGRASLDRVSILLEEKIAINDKETAKRMVPAGDIEYDLKEFTYPGEQEPQLKNIKFTLEKGSTLGIVGKTGAGKTSLLKLLIREFEGYEGAVLIDRRPLHDYQLDKLREAIGYVPQEHFLFSASVFENIAFADPSAPLEKVYDAAKIANIHHDILEFTEGYDTVVGERGVSLSGGQKQRISIARAILLNPEILILDDSLSAVDAKTEEAILEALKENREEKTTLITAHRLSAIKHADLILVVDHGEIVQRGTHEQLMEHDGWYRDMYLRQQLEKLVS